MTTIAGAYMAESDEFADDWNDYAMAGGGSVDVVATVARSFASAPIEGRADRVENIRTVFQYLLRCAERDTGVVEVGITELVTATGLGKATVQRALSELRDRGWVIVLERGQKGQGVTVQRVQMGHALRKRGVYMSLFSDARTPGLEVTAALAPRSIRGRPGPGMGWIGGGEPLAEWAISVIDGNARAVGCITDDVKRLTKDQPAWRGSRDYSDLFAEGEGQPPF